MQILDTLYGPIPASGFIERHPDGRLRSCTPAGEAVFETPYGPLVPQHSTDDLRRRTVQTLRFHENGQVRHLPLEQPALVDTPAGPLTAEMLTFHPDGSLHRAFPLNGKLSGYWTEADEGALARPVALKTPLGAVSARLINACFAPGGELLSLTLWPGETLRVPTPAGVFEARIGVNFRPDGSLRSLEPARPQPVRTPAGVIQAFDPDAVGVCGDVCSLGFGPDGGVERVTTSLTRLVRALPDGGEAEYAPELRESLCGDGAHEVTPLRLKFGPGMAAARTRPEARWTVLPLDGLRTAPFVPEFGVNLAQLPRVC